MASRIQAHVKGFLFRRRRKNALAKLAQASTRGQQKQQESLDLEDDIFAEENLAKDFDAEAFFDVK